MWSKDWRDRIWTELPHPWDVLIIGSGVTGAGIFLESVRAGLRILLVEANDFAYGASSRSSKLIHGDICVLRNKQFRAAYRSVKQREHLLKKGAWMIHPLPIYLPHYRKKDPWTSWIELAIYDLMGKKWQHTFLNKDKFIQKVNCMNTDNWSEDMSTPKL